MLHNQVGIRGYTAFKMSLQCTTDEHDMYVGIALLLCLVSVTSSLFLQTFTTCFNDYLRTLKKNYKICFTLNLISDLN